MFSAEVYLHFGFFNKVVMLLFLEYDETVFGSVSFPFSFCIIAKFMLFQFSVRVC